MRIKYFFFITVIMVAGAVEPAGAGVAQSEALFYEGNALYQEGRYREAAARYEEIREQGEESGSLYFRQGAYGKAMLNYERSRHFIPHDSDLKANQAYLSERLNLPSRQLPGGLIGRMNEWVWAPFSLNGRTIALSVLYILGLVMVFTRLFFKRVAAKRWFLAANLTAALLFVSCAGALARELAYINRAAVVISREVPARFEPQDEATVHFTLTEGMLVEVRREQGNWLKIRRGDGKSGWVDAKGVESVFRYLDKGQ